MHRTWNRLLLSSLLLLISTPMLGQRKPTGETRIKYISAQSYYIEAGKNQGIAIGDTLKVIRGKTTIALLRVVQASSKSAACSVVLMNKKPVIGDRVLFRVRKTLHKRKMARKKSSRRRTRSTRQQSRGEKINALSGYISVQNTWRQAMNGSSAGSVVPSFSGRLRIRNIAGSGLSLRLRHRSRRTIRTHATYPAANRNDDWYHRLFEASLVFESPGSPYELGFGRVLSPYIRGIGYIDGGHFSRQISEKIRVGFAAGTEPDLITSGVSGRRKKYGAFVAHQLGGTGNRRLSTTFALSASYENGIINREFVYLQNNLWLANRLSFFHSVEVDINRHWRRSATGNTLSFSNYYMNANIDITRAFSVNLSWDARKNVRTYATYYNSADSLFDENLHRGLSAGLRLNLPADMQFGATSSLRLRKESARNSIFLSSWLRVRHFPRRGHVLALRISWINTLFVTGYRPMLSWRLPLTRRMTLMIKNGAYLYDSAAGMSKNFYSEMQLHTTLMRAWFIELSYRQYYGTQLESLEAFVEAGFNF